MATESVESDGKFCISCGNPISKDAELCPDCGVRQEVSNLSSPTKYCADCSEEIKVEAEICPNCGVRQEFGAEGSDSSKVDGKPTAGEAFKLMLVYYQNHPIRGIIHAFVAILTAGAWLTWFIFFWFGTYVGWKDVEGMRKLRDSS